MSGGPQGKVAAVAGGTPTRTGTISPGCATTTYPAAVLSTAGLFPNQILSAYGIDQLQAGDLAGKVDAGGATDSEAAGPLLDDVAAPLVGHQPGPVEEDVRGDLQRPRQGKRAVGRAARVLERDPAHVE